MKHHGTPTSKRKLLKIVSFSILGFKWYGKSYYFGNASYAFPYLLGATNITKPIIVSIPKPFHIPTTTPKDFVWYTCISVLNWDNKVEESIQLWEHVVSLLDKTNGDYILLWKMAALLRVKASNSQTLNTDRPKTKD